MRRYASMLDPLYPHDLSIYAVSRIKESLRVKFATLANDFEYSLRQLSMQLTNLGGVLEVGTLCPEFMIPD